jgi:hypothetical protein
VYQVSACHKHPLQPHGTGLRITGKTLSEAIFLHMSSLTGFFLGVGGRGDKNFNGENFFKVNMLLLKQVLGRLIKRLLIMEIQ